MHLWCLTQLICKNLDFDGNAENALLKNEIQQKLSNVKKYVLTKISMFELIDTREHVFKVSRNDCEILTFQMKPDFLEAKLDNNNPVKIIEVLNLSSKYASLEREIPILEDFVEIIRIRCIKCIRSMTNVEMKLFTNFLIKIEKETKGNPDNYENAFNKIGEIVDYKNNQKEKNVYNEKIRYFKEYFKTVCHPDVEIVEPAFKKRRHCYSSDKFFYTNLECASSEIPNNIYNKKEKEKFDFSNCYKIEIDHHGLFKFSRITNHLKVLEFQVAQIERNWKNSTDLKTLILKNWNPSKVFIPWEKLEAGLQIWQKLTYLDMSNSKLTELPENVILKMPQSLETLRLAGNNIDKLSPNISCMTQLKVLSLSNNANLNDVGFPWDSLPVTLEELYLENTDLKIIQSAINRLNLKKFAVSGKNLNVISWKSFPSEIEELYISCGNEVNPMHSHEDLKYLNHLRIFHLRNANLNVNIWEKLPQNLQTVDLSFNQVSVLNCHYLLPNITTVILKNNKIYNVHWENIAKNLPNLVLLDLEGNSFVEFFSSLKCLPKLEVLNLSKNTLESINAEKLPSNLKELYLSENKINSITSIEILENLKNLNLTKNALKSAPLNISKLGKLQFLFLARNKLTSLPHGFENLINLRFLDLSFNNFYHKFKNISNDLWNRLPKFISTLYLSGNNLGELPCQLSKLLLDHLEANECNIRRICPQLQKYISNENPKIFESLLFDGKKVIDVRKNDDLLQLSFVPNKIYSPPTLQTKNSEIHDGYGEANFVLVTDFYKADKKRFKFQNTERFPMQKLKPFYDFSEKCLTLQEKAQLCQCCARCGAEEGGIEIETVMVMDFCLATVKEETVAYVAEEENLMILEIPIKPSEDIRTYKMSENWKRALKNRTTISDSALEKLLPKQWKSKIRTKMCHECIESIKTEISQSWIKQQEEDESRVSTPSLSETIVTKKTRKCAKQTVLSRPQNSNDANTINKEVADKSPTINITVNENPLQECADDSPPVTSQPLPSIEILQSNLYQSNSQYSIIGDYDEYEFFPEISNLPNTYYNQTEHNSITESPVIYNYSQFLSSADECNYSMDNCHFCPDPNSLNNNYLNNPSSSGLNSGTAPQITDQPFSFLSYPSPTENDMQSVMYFNNQPPIYSFDQEGHEDINHFVYTFPDDQE